jgi:hypothetical protein
MKQTLSLSILTIAAILILFTVGNSCKHESVGIDTIAAVCFETEILPIFTSNCAISGCHDGTGDNRLTLNDYSSIMKSISAGNPSKSDAYIAITNLWFNAMPPKGPLSEQQRTLIYVWIKQGAKNDTTCKGGTTTDTTTVVTTDSAYYVQDIVPILNNHCNMCHGTTTSGEERPPLDSWANVSSLTVPGNAASSKLYKSITASGDDIMPPADSVKLALTQVQINIIKQWITEGSKNNSYVSSTCDTTNVTYSGTIQTIIENNCSGCHYSGASIDLSSYSLVKARINRIYIDINQGSGSQPMPPNGSKLSDCQISQVKKWMNDGTLNN